MIPVFERKTLTVAQTKFERDHLTAILREGGVEYVIKTVSGGELPKTLKGNGPGLGFAFSKYEIQVSKKHYQKALRLLSQSGYNE